MTDPDQLRRLYRDVVIEHSRNPHNFRRIDSPSASADGHNPLCGDRITVYLRTSNGDVDDAAFEAVGCAISLASASMLTDMVAGHTRAEASAITRDVLDMLESRAEPADLGPINALCGVRAYPSRVRCATLPWRTLQAALAGKTGGVVSTEREET